jgi:hypothetical protein
MTLETVSTPCTIVSSMLGLNSAPHTQERPRGVTIIVAVCGLLSATSLAFAALLLVHEIPLAAGASLLGGGLEQLGVLAFLLYGAILAVLGLALWRRWRGSRRAAIVLAAAGIVLAMPAISSAFGDERLYATIREAIQIMLRVLVIYYLSQEPVKEWFAKS